MLIQSLDKTTTFPFQYSSLDALSISLRPNSRYDFGFPSEEQLTQINRYKPYGTPDYDRTEIVSVTFRASDNLLSHSYGVWSEKSLNKMAELFPGKPLIMDHEWEDVDDTVGFIYGSEVVKSPTVEDEVLRHIDYEINKKIVAQSGYIQLLLFAAIAADHPVVSNLRYRRASGVSTGGYADNNYLCPICSARYGQEISFNDPRCPHFFPSARAFELALDEEEYALIAPYYVRGEWVESIELSLVIAPNLPNAKML